MARRRKKEKPPEIIPIEPGAIRKLGTWIVFLVIYLSLILGSTYFFFEPTK